MFSNPKTRFSQLTKLNRRPALWVENPSLVVEAELFAPILVLIPNIQLSMRYEALAALLSPLWFLLSHGTKVSPMPAY